MLHIHTCEKMHKPGGKSSFSMPLEKNLVSFGDCSLAINQLQLRSHFPPGNRCVLVDSVETLFLKTKLDDEILIKIITPRKSHWFPETAKSSCVMRGVVKARGGDSSKRESWQPLCLNEHAGIWRVGRLQQPE